MMNELMYILLSPLLTEMLRGQVNILSAAIVPSIQKKKKTLCSGNQVTPLIGLHHHITLKQLQ